MKLGTIGHSVYTAYMQNYMEGYKTGSEKREVLGVGSIPVAILPSCQDMKTICIIMQRHEYSWVIKNGNTSEVV